MDNNLYVLYNLLMGPELGHSQRSSEQVVDLIALPAAAPAIAICEAILFCSGIGAFVPSLRRERTYNLVEIWSDEDKYPKIGDEPLFGGFSWQVPVFDTSYTDPKFMVPLEQAPANIALIETSLVDTEDIELNADQIA